MSQVTEEIRAKAEMYFGHEICKEKSQELLRECGLPNGLLPMQEIEECGIVRETGFVWMKQKKSTTHTFEKIGKPVSYATDVTAIAEPFKIKKLTGVKAKELLVWVTLCDIYVDNPPTGKIIFKTPAGLSRSFPVSAFVVEEANPKAVASKETKDDAKEGVDEETKEVVNAQVGAKEESEEANGALAVKEV